jgi:Flp pilus assembly secretin CpaC
MRAALFILSALTVLSGAVVPAQAQEMRVALDESRAIETRQPISGIVIGNPSVAGVSVQNERLLFVTGRSYGQTNVIIVGPNGRPIMERRISVVPDETNVVMVTRGAATARLECNPQCRRRPDLSDDPEAFSKSMEQITTRAGVARVE